MLITKLTDEEMALHCQEYMRKYGQTNKAKGC